MLENKKIGELVTTDVLCVHENQELSDVTALFRENEIHHVPVLKGKKPVGIISTQDDRMLDTLLNHNYKITDVMTSKLVILNEGSTIKDVAKLLIDSSYHSVLVVDNKGDLTGIVTTTDLIKYLHDNTA